MSINFAKKAKKRPHHYFIPSAHNDHRPHFIRHKALHAYSIALITVKIFVLAFLFITFPNVAEFSTVTSNRIIELTNQARVAQGLPLLTRNSDLDKSAMLKAQHMLENNYFAHNSPVDGATPWDFFKAAGYNYTFAGENLAMNFTEAEEAVNAWLDSPTHRANIMNNNYDEIGVAVVVGKINGYTTTLVVQHFGKTFIAANSPKFAKASGEIVPQVAGTTQVSSGKAVEVTFKTPAQRSTIAKIAFYAQKFIWIMLVFIAINLLLTIFIRIRIQHKPIIAHSILVLVIGLLSLIVHPHFIESIANGSIRIL